MPSTARLFANQQAHDWLIIQSEAQPGLQSLGIRIPGKVISFSSQNRRADVFMDRGLLISRINGWSGPLFNMAECPLQGGEHHAENVMAAMLVGHILKISVESMKLALNNCIPLPSRGGWCGTRWRDLHRRRQCVQSSGAGLLFGGHSSRPNPTNPTCVVDCGRRYQLVGLSSVGSSDFGIV